jgi:hypothetical protein
MTSSKLVGCSTGRSAGFAPFENLVDIHSDAAVLVREVHPVGHQTSGIYATVFAFSVALVIASGLAVAKSAGQDDYDPRSFDGGSA